MRGDSVLAVSGSCFQTCLYRVIQINSKHSGQVDRFRVNRINFVRDISVHLDIRIDVNEKASLIGMHVVSYKRSFSVIHCFLEEPYV